jgi:hypothetical protein
MKSTLTLLALIVFMPGETAGQTYSAGGAGNSSCGTWTLDTQWLLGFLSGIGFLGKAEGLDPLNGVDAQAVLAWIDNWCHNHPLSPIADAGAAFKNVHPN